jgi:hypothetical protein
MGFSGVKYGSANARFACLIAATSAIAFGVGGCSSQPAGATVTATIYFDGQPLADAVIRLWPKEDLTLGVYGGKTDAEGKMELAYPGGKLVKPGKYVVLVAKQPPHDQTSAGSREKEQITILSGHEAFRNVLPAIYSDKTRSPLVVDIKPGHNDLSRLELTRLAP